MDWKTLLAYITGTVDQELLLRNEYLVTENRILRNQLKGRPRLSDGERTARFCRKFCSEGYDGAVAPVCAEIKQQESRTVRPQ